jgi:hypothetical protein
MSEVSVSRCIISFRLIDLQCFDCVFLDTRAQAVTHAAKLLIAEQLEDKEEVCYSFNYIYIIIITILDESQDVTHLNKRKVVLCLAFGPFTCRAYFVYTFIVEAKV